MTTALYTIWLLVPGVFFLMALWGFLENLGTKKTKRHKPGDQLTQGLFVLLCVGLCIWIDSTVLPQVVESVFPEWLPLEFFQVLLLPLVLYLGAMIAGPSKDPAGKPK